MISKFSSYHPFFKYRIILLILIIPIFIAGLTGDFYTGPGHEWFNGVLGDFLLPVFMILVISFIFPRISPFHTALWVFVYNTAIEFTQLSEHPFLEAVRPTLFGRLVIGEYFSWDDIICYLAGCFTGWLLIYFIQNKFSSSKMSF